jgi:cell shape-determining protein MreC
MARDARYDNDNQSAQELREVFTDDALLEDTERSILHVTGVSENVERLLGEAQERINALGQKMGELVKENASLRTITERLKDENLMLNVERRLLREENKKLKPLRMESPRRT